MPHPQPQETLHRKIAEAYQLAQAFHDPVPLPLALYEQHLLTALRQAVGDKDDIAALEPVFDRLYRTDFYLAVACRHGGEAAWQRLRSLYEKLIYDTAWFVCQNRALAEDVAGGTLGYLFLQDGSGKSRIAAYNGQHQLASWLRTIVAYQTLKECERPYHRFRRLDDLPEIADLRSLADVEASIRTRQCQTILHEVLAETVQQLSERARVFLLLRYYDDAKFSDMAALLGVSAPTVSYYLKQAKRQIKEGIVSQLKDLYRFDEATISSFVEELCANPAYALLRHLKMATGS